MILTIRLFTVDFESTFSQCSPLTYGISISLLWSFTFDLKTLTYVNSWLIDMWGLTHELWSLILCIVSLTYDFSRKTSLTFAFDPWNLVFNLSPLAYELAYLTFHSWLFKMWSLAHDLWSVTFYIISLTYDDLDYKPLASSLLYFDKFKLWGCISEKTLMWHAVNNGNLLASGFRKRNIINFTSALPRSYLVIFARRYYLWHFTFQYWLMSSHLKSFENKHFQLSILFIW